MSQVTLKTPEELAIMREAGRIVARAHEAMRQAVKPGVSTWELDQIAEDVIRSSNAIPSFVGYPKHNSPDFPSTITASINHELVHGIPSKSRILKEGDIISLDVACHYQGFVGDAACTWGVGKVSQPVQRLIDVARETLYASIAQAVAGNRISDIARATQDYAGKHGYSVALEYTGHGVGRAMHEPPSVPNWWPKKANRGSGDVLLRPGMTIAIEPMVIAGRNQLTELEDKWTVVTRDRSLCAHWEHTVAITNGEPLILTAL